MKKVIIMALVLVASATFNTADAAKKKKKTEEPAPVAEAPVELVSGSDSVSYAGGMSITAGLVPYLQQQGVDTAYMADFVQGFKDMIRDGENPQYRAHAAGMQIAEQVKTRMLTGMTNEFKDSPDSIKADLLYRGFVAALSGDTTHFSVARADEYFKQKQQADKLAKEEKLYGPNRDAGRRFLAENAGKEGVVTTPSGLQYKVLVKGEGEVPQTTDKVLVHYEGRLVDGTVFDASRNHGDNPSSFRPDQVIKGWTEALTMMPVGSKWQLYIPQELGYGSRNAGKIPPYSTLIFDVELVGIDKPKTETPVPAAKKPAAKKTVRKK